MVVYVTSAVFELNVIRLQRILSFNYHQHRYAENLMPGDATATDDK